MRFIILEDEKLAADRLKKLIKEIRPNYQHVLTMDSVESAVISLPSLKTDLVFMDIQLADGLSFDIFDQIHFDRPIIFTTAYDEYAIRAFKANSIDYLLKPIDQEELSQAIHKFEKQATQHISQLDKLMKSLQPGGKERFVVKVGEHLKTVESIQVQLVYSQDKATYLFTEDGKRYLIDYSLDRVEELLDASQFFRISRKFLVNLNYIKDIVAYTNSRLQIMLNHFDQEQVIVARERVNEFRQWLDR